MNNKKKMVLGAAFIVAIMALAGVGYAAFNETYKGTAESKTQEYDVDYVIVKLGGQAYTQPGNLYIVYNTETTYTTQEVTSFKWMGSTAVSHTVTATVPTQSSETQDPDGMVLKADVTFNVSGYKLQYKVGSATTWTTYDSAISDTGVEISANTPLTIAWRAVPNDAAISDTAAPEDGGTEGIAITTDPSTGQGLVTLPAITYEVVATQHPLS